MGGIRTGTVGYSYRDWAGIFFPQGTPPRRQFSVYASHFDVCELTHFTHQMPDVERVASFAAQIKTDLKLFVRIHNTFTHCADIGLALTVSKHFRKAMEPLVEGGQLAGLVGAFPYAFKNSGDNRDYLLQLSSALDCNLDRPLQLDFRHPSWFSNDAIEWLNRQGLGMVCVDEPSLPGLVPPLAVSTAKRVLVRLHGRNAQGWWSGNQATRYDYLYSPAELAELYERYSGLMGQGREVSFLFHNNWQAQSVQNAKQWKALFEDRAAQVYTAPTIAAPSIDFSNVASPSTSSSSGSNEDDESLRPPTSLPLSEVKSRVTRALSVAQESLDLPPRES